MKKIKTGSPNILLIGIGGVYNYGCEAIVRGTEIILRKEYPDANIIYASRRVSDDTKRLQGSNVSIIDRGKSKRYSVKNIIRKLLSLLGIKWFPVYDSMNLLEGIDAVFSIGGDLYTLSSSGQYSLSLPKFCEAAQKQGIPYILWGASIGPFSRNTKAERIFRAHLLKVDLITAREKESIEYLNKLSISRNVIQCADPAYLVASEIVSHQSRIFKMLTIGINLSPLSAGYLKKSLDEIIMNQTKVIEEIITEFNANILLIPHVVSNSNINDDDLRYLQNILTIINPTYHNSISLIDSDIGFIETKRQLTTCDIVIAARMHCAINALSAHIPTLLLSYSAKARGMAQYVYNNNNWVLPLDDFHSQNTQLFNTLSSLVEKRKILSDYLSKRIPQIQADALNPLARIREII